MMWRCVHELLLRSEDLDCVGEMPWMADFESRVLHTPMGGETCTHMAALVWNKALQWWHWHAHPIDGQCVARCASGYIFVGRCIMANVK